MKRINIDFGRARPRPSALTLGLLAAGFLVCTVGVWRYAEAGAAIEQLDSALNTARDNLAAKHPAIDATAALPPMSDQQLLTINQAITQLNLPWQALFKVFEAAKPKTIAILSLEPNGKKQSVKVQAEAKTPDDMIGFIETLKQQPLFADVLLQKHEINEQDPNRPYRFILEARWRDRDRDTP